MNKDLLVDYVEGELPVSLALDVELMLSHSAKERECVETLETVKRSLKSAKEPLPDNEFFNNMHDKIMLEVMQKTNTMKSPQPSQRMRHPLRNLQRYWRWGHMALALFFAVSVFDFGSFEQMKKEIPSQMVEIIKSKEHKHADLSRGVLTYQLEDDLIIELANNQMQNSSTEDNNEVVKYLMN